MAHGNAVRRNFVGDARVCRIGHEFLVTEGMFRNKSYTCPTCASAYAVEYARRNREMKRASNRAYQYDKPPYEFDRALRASAMDLIDALQAECERLRAELKRLENKPC